MNAVSSSTSPGMTDLMQLLTSSGSPLLNSGLSSTQLQSALQDASPGDLVQLSNQAVQLQTVDGLFGASDTSQTSSSDTLESLVASLSANSTSTTAATTDT